MTNRRLAKFSVGGKRNIRFLISLLAVLIALIGIARPVIGAQQRDTEPSKKVAYKTFGDLEMKIWLFMPTQQQSVSRPAVVFFHGGAWSTGSPNQFSGQAKYLARLGVVAAAAEYRLSKAHGTTPLESVLDAKSAIRWLRANSPALGIDPSRIGAAGGSAGGHLALSTAILDDVNEDTDDLAVSPKPNALILFNPIVKIGKAGFKRENAENISPYHRLNSPLPPTIIFHGTEDKVAPYASIQAFADKARLAGSKEVTVIPYEGRGHAFFNYSQKNTSRNDYLATLIEMEKFLRHLGWID